MIYKIFLAFFFFHISFLGHSKTGLFPLECGEYAIRAKGTSIESGQLEFILKEKTFSKTLLYLTSNQSENHNIYKDQWMKLKLKIISKKHPYQVMATTNQKIEIINNEVAKIYGESIDFIQGFPCIK